MRTFCAESGIFFSAHKRRFGSSSAKHKLDVAAKILKILCFRVSVASYKILASRCALSSRGLFLPTCCYCGSRHSQIKMCRYELINTQFKRFFFAFPDQLVERFARTAALFNFGFFHRFFIVYIIIFGVFAFVSRCQL